MMSDGPPVALDEDRPRRAARERLDPGRAAAGEEIQDARADEVRLEDREERLLHPVGQRPRPLPRRRRQPAARRAPGDDPPGVSHSSRPAWASC